MADVEMTPPDILKVERWGYIHPPPNPQIVGQCEQCKNDITDEYEYYETKDGLFCSDECLKKYYEIVLKS